MNHKGNTSAEFEAGFRQLRPGTSKQLREYIAKALTNAAKAGHSLQAQELTAVVKDGNQQEIQIALRRFETAIGVTN